MWKQKYFDKNTSILGNDFIEGKSLHMLDNKTLKMWGDPAPSVPTLLKMKIKSKSFLARLYQHRRKENVKKSPKG